MKRRPRLYNKKNNDAPVDAVYIGRPSQWGNLYSHLPGTLARFQVASRDEAIAAFERDLKASPEWIAKVKAELRGKDLLCWCYPLRCHGEALLRVANEEEPMRAIDRFDGEFKFLSNFFTLPTPMTWGDPTRPGWPATAVWTTEAAFQSAKAKTQEDRNRIASIIAPGQAKRAGRAVDVREDWEVVRGVVMLAALREKFAIPAMREKLLATADANLIEGNTWHDSYWGHCTCGRCRVGKNNLGRLLMQVRTELSAPAPVDELSTRSLR